MTDQEKKPREATVVSVKLDDEDWDTLMNACSITGMNRNTIGRLAFQRLFNSKQFRDMLDAVEAVKADG